MQLTLSVSGNTVSWVAEVDTKPHTLEVGVWFGKKKTRSTKVYPLVSWANWMTNAGEFQPTGELNLDLNLLEPSWKVANYIGSISQFNEVDSPADQYNTVDAATVVVKK